MSLELFVIGMLTVLLIAQNVYWARVHFSLMNRLMCRDFAEFAHGEKIMKQKQEKPQLVTPPQDEIVDQESERQANELNTLFNMA